MVNLACREGSGKRATRVEENALSNHKPSNFWGAYHLRNAKIPPPHPPACVFPPILEWPPIVTIKRAMRFL